jgi:hypothetical protein
LVSSEERVAVLGPDLSDGLSSTVGPCAYKARI